ncbi:MAG TPA: insulinase family protein [Candidatus Acidoferrum sp.]|nr:insulinase family protein [Candidatus Acidoferrum sp.]
MSMFQQPRTRGTLAALALFALLLVGSSLIVVHHGAVRVDKSPNDKRDYRALTLGNGMKVLLISDPDADRAAASVNVAAGSNGDPAEFHGLAHFLEHMLFLGTRKYPAADEYEEYISSHGGGLNAYTAYDNTNFHFELDASYLEPALDRFSQFFISPLFSEEYVNRERNAVNSEYQSGLQDDARRSQAVVKAAMNQRHPMAGFAVGSLDTLQDHGNARLRDALLAHYDRYYSANLMSLVIFGKENLNQLEAWARTYFSAVPNKHRSKPVSKEPLFAAGQLPLQIDIDPIRDTRSLSYSFPIPDMRARYRERPLDYLANMLGHEGEGSLLKVLRDLGWANALSAGGGIEGDDANMFDINIALTQDGLQHVDDISALLFQFIDVIGKQGISEWRYKELATMSSLAFQYQEPGEIVGLVTGMSERMQYFPLQDLITADYFYRDYNPQLIRAALDYLRPDNVVLTLSAHGLPVDRTEPWYQAHYSAATITQSRLQAWRNAPRNGALAATQPNPFIPENLTLRPLKGPKLPHGGANVAYKPQLIVNSGGVRLWFKQDNEFFTPRVNFFVYAQTPLLQENLHNSLLGTFVVSLVNDKLSAYAYPATLAGADFGIGTRNRGLTLALSGYSDKQGQLLETLLKTLTTADFQQDRFDIIRTELVRSWQNATLRTPYTRLQSEVQGLLVNPYWSNEENIAEVRNITLDEVKAFVPKLLASLRLDALFHGNGDENDAKALLALVERYLPPSASAPVPRFGSVVKLPQRTRIVDELALAHDDSAIVIYEQAEDTSLRARAMIGMISTLMAQSFFDTLRTQQQLGYVVSAGTLPILNVNGLMFTIESPVADPQTLETRINAFLASFGNTLDTMPPEQFADIKNGLLNDLRQLPEQLDNLSSRYWSDILLEELDADSQLKLSEAVAQLTQGAVVDYYHRVIANPATTRVVARSFGRNMLQSRKPEPAGTVLLDGTHGNYAGFKAGQAVYNYP